MFETASELAANKKAAEQAEADRSHTWNGVVLGAGDTPITRPFEARLTDEKLAEIRALTKKLGRGLTDQEYAHVMGAQYDPSRSNKQR